MRKIKGFKLEGCDLGTVSVYCNPGDIAIGGGGHCGYCANIATMEQSCRVNNGWVIECDENGNATADRGYVDLVVSH